VFCKGSLNPLEEKILPHVSSGDQLDVIIEFITPMDLGRQKGVWKVNIGEKRFGRLPIAVINTTAETIDEKIAHVVAMGFEPEDARKALEATSGDLNQAISQILLKA